jgi:hypothetical protein
VVEDANGLYGKIPGEGRPTSVTSEYGFGSEGGTSAPPSREGSDESLYATIEPQ